MPTTEFDRDAMAHWYATEQRKTDPGIRTIYYLKDAPDREIRFLVVNDLIGERSDPLEPFELGVDRGTENSHSLLFLDVTPQQWELIKNKSVALPSGWTLNSAEALDNN